MNRFVNGVLVMTKANRGSRNGNPVLSPLWESATARCDECSTVGALLTHASKRVAATSVVDDMVLSKDSLMGILFLFLMMIGCWLVSTAMPSR